MNDTSITENPRARIGGNAPPLTLYEQAEKRVEDVYGEAKLWLDGATVDSQELADGIANLIDTLRKARTFADDTRKTEKKPLDDLIAEIQERYNPLLQKADLAIDTCKRAVAPWLQKRADEIAEAARKAREEAEAKRRIAEDALRASFATDITKREAAEKLLKDAKKAETAANVAGRQVATAGGAFGRATGLRTIMSAAIDDPVLAARTVWSEDREAMLGFLIEWAERQVRGGRRGIPGFKIIESKVPV